MAKRNNPARKVQQATTVISKQSLERGIIISAMGNFDAPYLNVFSGLYPFGGADFAHEMAMEAVKKYNNMPPYNPTTAANWPSKFQTENGDWEMEWGSRSGKTYTFGCKGGHYDHYIQYPSDSHLAESYSMFIK